MLHVNRERRNNLTIVFGTITFAAFFSNVSLVVYIVVRRLFKNFVSSHFIANHAIISMLACVYLIPIFISNVNTASNILGNDGYNQSTALCRFHAFITCTVWSATYYMTTCIAGVHLLTFARIHYEQMFGLRPSIICVLSWIIGAALGLPCLTNESIVAYDQKYHYCLWNHNQNGCKFLAYFLSLGILLPSGLTIYSYTRVLLIFYHAPIVFETLGLFRSRYIIFFILLNQFFQWPFFVSRFLYQPGMFGGVLIMFLTYLPNLSLGLAYGVSLFLMKEDDIALTTRSH
ncbi:unnamed protein product, partial [Soboliphyme baturini]|uniref:G_PROTEIN_RECEP_F1_2 domain-containing protein n=1 Tax=Soboliphyme baturini TaxID=241478 RepID=A0A183IAN7_9BILA